MVLKTKPSWPGRAALFGLLLGSMASLPVLAQIDGDAAPEEPDVIAPNVPDAAAAALNAFDSGSPDSEIFDAPPDDPGERYQTDGSDQDNFNLDDRKALEAAFRDYAIEPLSGASLHLSPPTLPDLSRYTAANAIAKIDKRRKGRASVESVLNTTTFRGFMGTDERMRQWAARQHSLPKAIFIRDGYVTPADIARQVPKALFAQVSPGVYVARLPISVQPGAIFHIDDSVKDFRLSLDRGSFLVNEGKLFLTGTQLRGWNEAKKAPSLWFDKDAFRPFIVSWGGSQTYIVKSSVSNLGYAASKSYGVSISQYSPSMAPLMNKPNPTGWIIDSEFYDNWYGFYCYETDDFVIRGSTYRDNIVYGIDPHDRSKRLIIAENKAYNTHKKHGIIVSREVNDSWIINNEAYDNTLSGIVIDRNSINNVVAQNRSYRNHSDGITVYESPRTLMWQNLVSANRRHGIRVRNSTNVRLHENIAVGNGLSGVYGHVKNLAGTGRDIRLDPFHTRISMTVVGGQLVSNGSSPVSIDQPLSLELYDVDLRAPQRELGIKFTGILGKHQQQVLDILMRQKRAVIVRPTDVKVTAEADGTAASKHP